MPVIASESAGAWSVETAPLPVSPSVASSFGDLACAPGGVCLAIAEYLVPCTSLCGTADVSDGFVETGQLAAGAAIARAETRTSRVIESPEGRQPRARIGTYLRERGSVPRAGDASGEVHGPPE